MAVANIGIDLGTSSIVVYVKGKGIIIREPALVAFDKDADKVRAIGDEAVQLIGHTSGNVVAIRPLAEGKISDFIMTERMLKYFVDKAIGRRGIRKPRISICVPSRLTDVERRAVIEATYQAGARDVTLVKEPVAAAIGAELDITRADGNMVVDIGGGLTDIAVMSLCGIVLSSAVDVAGDSFTAAIIRHLREDYNVFVGEQTAEAIKMRLASSNSRTADKKMSVNGRNIETGLPKTVTLDRQDVFSCFQEVFEKISDAVKNVLEKTPPDLLGDICNRGILLTGGGSQIDGLADMLEAQTGIHILTSEKPASVVAIGTGRYHDVITEFEERY